MNDEPTIAQEITDRKAGRDRVAAYFLARPLEALTQASIAAATGVEIGSLRTRVSDCRLELHMEIETIGTSYIGSDGKRHRGISLYRFVPYVPLGRDASTRVAQTSLF